MDMNLLKKTIPLLCILLVACSSSRIKAAEKNVDNSEISEELRPIGNFKEITMSTVADIYFYQEKGSPTLTIKGEKEMVDLIKTSTENGVLKIYTTEKDFNNNGKKRVKIELSAPSVEKISVTGVGDVYMENPVSLDNLHLRLSGVGNMYIKKLSCNELSVSLSGVGNIDLAGKCKYANLKMQGVGHIDCRRLTGQTTSKATGVGSIKTANGEIKNP